MSEKEVKKIKKYEIVPPDGGWGYMIIISSVIMLVSVSMFLTNFGMIFKDLFIELDMESTSITLIHGISCFNVAIGGFFTNSMLNFLSIRKLGMVAAFVFNFGLFCTVFVQTKITFFISFGVLQGLGHGVIFNLSQTILKNYFIKRRLLAFSSMQTIVGLVLLFIPQLVKWTLDKYEFRGTQLLLTGLSMNTFVAMALIQPVSWHMKKVEIPEDKDNEMKSLMPEDKQEDLTSSNKILEAKTSATKNCKDQEQSQNNRIKSLILKVIDISEYKSFLLSNASVGVALSIFTDVTFTVMLPQALYSMGWDEGNVALAMSLNAMGDLVMRGLFIVASKWLKNIGSHEIYLTGLVLALISRLGMLGSDNMMVMTVFITLMGAARCVLMLLLPVVIADAVGEVKFTSAMGLFMLMYGFFNLILGPAIGGVRDLTDSYPTAFYVLSSCFGIVIMFWMIELIYKKNKHKRQLRKSFTKA